MLPQDKPALDVDITTRHFYRETALGGVRWLRGEREPLLLVEAGVNSPQDTENEALINMPHLKNVLDLRY